MKVNWNTKYTTIAVYTFLVVCSVILFYLGLSKLGVVIDKLSYFMVILQPIIMGFGIAYLFNFILRFFENKVLKDSVIKKTGLKSKRGVAILLTYLTGALIIALFLHFVLPQLIESIVGLANSIPSHIENLSKFLDDLLESLDLKEEYINMLKENWNEFVNYIIKFLTDLIPILGSFFTSLASKVWNIVLGLIISIYLLIDKEKFCALFKKITYAICNEKIANKLVDIAHTSNDTFGKFLSGKILDSAIIGVLTFIVLSLCSMPYTLLVSVIVGITNIIPFFGPFIGAVPSVIIILFVSPVKALWFLVIILIIQQIDGNIIGPKILGNSIGISAFWILFSILVAGKFLGLIGMIIGVPLFAVFYTLVKEFIENRLKNKGLKVDTKDYF
ncbi:MAG: AI-2E family transporter [Clostridiaceae bacterium]|nr:AI-2E family transporter [Clostridiaceae bacterium]